MPGFSAFRAGFWALSARALARAGHTLHAASGSRNTARVAAAA
ncbi:hypothetical protein ACIBP6_37630 [Nonomuraea terrae]